MKLSKLIYLALYRHEYAFRLNCPQPKECLRMNGLGTLKKQCQLAYSHSISLYNSGIGNNLQGGNNLTKIVLLYKNSGLKSRAF